VIENGPALASTLLAGNCGNAALVARFTFTANGCTTSVNDILRGRTTYQNGPPIQASGLDFSANFTAPDVSGATFSAGIDATYNLSFKVDALKQFGATLLQAYDAVGRFNAQVLPRTLPEFRGQGWMNLAFGRHNLRATVTYSGPVRDERATGTGAATDLLAQVPGFPIGTVVTAGTRIDSWTTVDLAYRFEVWTDTSLSLTVNNVLDSSPPLARTDLSYDAFVANPLGRVIKLGVSAKF